MPTCCSRLMEAAGTCQTPHAKIVSLLEGRNSLHIGGTTAATLGLSTRLILQVNGVQVIVHHKTGKVQCAQASLQARVTKAVMRLRLAMGPASREDEGGSSDDEEEAFEPPLKLIAA